MTSWGIIATHFCLFFEVCTGVELNDIRSLPAVIAKTEKDLRSMNNLKKHGDFEELASRLAMLRI